METIFDHNVTDEEMINLFGSIYSKEEYLSDVGDSKNSVYVDLAYLFYERGLVNKAKAYIRKVSDVNLVLSFWRTVNHPTVPTFI